MAEIWRNRTALEILALTLAVLAITIPFVNKAFDWDDREFIEFAQIFAEEPLKLHLEDFSYKGLYYDEFRTTHPPLPSQYLSLFLRLGFEVSEPLMRTAYAVFPLIAAISMYALARRFTRHPFLAALLLVVTPGFFVTSHTLMGDMPGLAMWLLSVSLFVWGADRGSWRLLIAAGLAMSVAVLTAYQAISVIPLLLLYALINRRFRPRVFLPFLLPALAFGLYTLFIYNRYGGFPVLAYRLERSLIWADPELKARALLVFMGGGIVFAPAALAVLFRRKLDLLIGFLLLPPLVTWAAVYYLGEDQLSLQQALLVAAMSAAGFSIIYGAFSSAVSGAISAIRQRDWYRWTDPFFLLVWLSGVLTYAAVFLPFVAERFLLPLFPPAIIIFVSATQTLWRARPRVRTAFFAVTVALTFALGLGAALADYRVAGTQRTAAGEMQERYGTAAGQKWMLGEFGFRYYMQRAGFEYLGVNSEARSGEIVISSRLNSEEVVAPLPEGIYQVLEVRRFADGFPVRVMNRDAGAGFYAHRLGPVPLIFSREELDEVTVYELDW